MCETSCNSRYKRFVPETLIKFYNRLIINTGLPTLPLLGLRMGFTPIWVTPLGFEFLEIHCFGTAPD